MLINVICPSVLKCFHLHLAELEPTSTNINTSTNLNPALQPTINMTPITPSPFPTLPSIPRAIISAVPTCFALATGSALASSSFWSITVSQRKAAGNLRIPKCSQNQWSRKSKHLQISPNCVDINLKPLFGIGILKLLSLQREWTIYGFFPKCLFPESIVWFILMGARFILSLNQCFYHRSTPLRINNTPFSIEWPDQKKVASVSSFTAVSLWTECFLFLHYEMTFCKESTPPIS